MPKNTRAITLLELIIAITLLGVIVIGFSSIELFSRSQTLSADRKAQVQNEAAYVLEHMTKEISRVVGSIINPAVVIISDTSPLATTFLIINIDTNNDGIADSGPWNGYSYFDETNTSPNLRNRITYCPPLSNVLCQQAALNTNTQDISNKITNFIVNYDNIETDGDTIDNYLEIELTARWDPALPSSLDNPEITMRTRIKMPSVSTH